MSESPYVGVVVDLVDPYFTPDAKKVGGFKSETSAGNYALWWMRNHPGRWAVVAEGTTGLTRHILKISHPDIEVKENSGARYSDDGIARTFARLPHPEGEPLLDALKRRPAPGLYLPEVTRDEFNWSPRELAEACQIARDNLFPVSS